MPLKLTLVYKTYFSEYVEAREDLTRLDMRFRPNYSAPKPTHAELNGNKKKLRKFMNSIKHLSFKKIQLICASGMYVNGFENARFLGLLQVKTSDKLKIISFRWCALSEKFICYLHQFVKQRMEEKRALEHIQFLRLYKDNINELNQSKVGYLVSRIALFSSKYFHTQMEAETNRIFYKYFINSAELCNRKKIKSFVSIGGYFRAQGLRTAEYEAYAKCMKVKLYGNPLHWNQLWGNVDKILLQERIVYV